MPDLAIGELSRLSGVRVANIRYYEDIGILPPAMRGESHHRIYNDDDVRRLMFVKTSRALGFSLKHIRTLLHLTEPDNLNCDAALALSCEQLSLVRDKISTLQSIEQTLQDHIVQCRETCTDGRAPACRILGPTD